MVAIDVCCCIGLKAFEDLRDHANQSTAHIVITTGSRMSLRIANLPPTARSDTVGLSSSSDILAVQTVDLDLLVECPLKAHQEMEVLMIDMARQSASG